MDQEEKNTVYDIRKSMLHIETSIDEERRDLEQIIKETINKRDSVEGFVIVCMALLTGVFGFVLGMVMK